MATIIPIRPDVDQTPAPAPTADELFVLELHAAQARAAWVEARDALARARMALGGPFVVDELEDEL